MTLTHRLFSLVRTLLVTCLISALPANALAQVDRNDDSKSRVPGDVTAAHLFVMAAYPDLFAHATALTIRRVDTAIVIEVAEAPTGKGREAIDGPTLLTATISFDAAGRLVTYAATGSFLDETRNRALYAAVATHPEWSDSDKDAWLRQSGGPATAGPNAPGLTTLQNASFLDKLGADTVMTQPKFQWGESPKQADAPLVTDTSATRVTSADVKVPKPPRPALAVPPVWTVDVTADALSAKPVRYRLQYEPFGGRLIGAVRQ